MAPMRLAQLLVEVAHGRDRLLALTLRFLALGRDVIIGAEIEGLDLALLVAPARNDDDRDRGASIANAPDDFQPVQVWQPEVQDEQVRRILPDRLERPPSGRHLRNKIALAGQACTQKPQDRWLIVDDKHPQRPAAFFVMP